MKKRKIMWTRVSGFLAATALFSFCMLARAADSAGYTNDLCDG